MAIALDGHVTGNSGSASSLAVSLTTTAAGMVFVAAVLNGGPITGVSDVAGLTWTRRTRVLTGAHQYLEEWYAVSAGALTTDSITVSGTTADFITVTAWGISGADTSTIFDSNAGLPVTVTSGDCLISTSNANDFIFAAYLDGGAPTAGSGWTVINSANFLIVEYQIVSATQTNLDATYSGTTTSGLGDAVMQASAVGIAFDASTNSAYQTAASTYSWSHTCTGANRYLFVAVAMLSVAGSSVSALTYNGVNLTFLGARATVSGTVRQELWGLIAPATGAHTVAITLSASLDSIGEAVSLTGVDQIIAVEALMANNGTATGGDAAVSVGTIADNDWVVGAVASDDTSITIANGTERQNVSGTLGSGALATSGPKTPPGSVTISWTGVGALASWAIVGVGVRPLAAVNGWGRAIAGERNMAIAA